MLVFTPDVYRNLADRPTEWLLAELDEAIKIHESLERQSVSRREPGQMAQVQHNATLLVTELERRGNYVRLPWERRY